MINNHHFSTFFFLTYTNFNANTISKQSLRTTIGTGSRIISNWNPRLLSGSLQHIRERPWFSPNKRLINHDQLAYSPPRMMPFRASSAWLTTSNLGGPEQCEETDPRGKGTRQWVFRQITGCIWNKATRHLPFGSWGTRLPLPAHIYPLN